MVDNVFYVQAIQALCPNEGFTIDDMDYSTLVFTNDIEKPTEEEINAKFIELKSQYNNIEYQRLRAVEYPPIEDFADAWVKNDEQALEDYRQKCLAVKAKYPKP